MKLSIPPINISDEEGFTDAKDIFERKHFGEALLRLVSDIEDELIIALDSKWGEGKTTFIKMWRGLLSQHEIKSIYFDAFASDYIDDPFTAFTGEIYDLAREVKAPPKKIQKYKNQTVRAGKVLLKSTVKVGLKALTYGLLDGTELEKIGIDKDIAEEASKTTDQYLTSILNNYKKDKASLLKFRESLGEIAEAVSNSGKPLIFIIDELDRCKPTFALEVLEKIKHIFSVPKIVFVLVMNREQIEQAVKCKYGLDINANQYLQKFVHIWCTLPKRSDEYSSDAKTYLGYLLAQHNFPIDTRFTQLMLEDMEKYVNYYSPSLRDMEQIVRNLIITKIAMYNMQNYHRLLVPFLAIVKSINMNLFQKLQSNTCSYTEICNELKLKDLKSAWLDDKEEKHPLTWMLRYCLINDDELKKIPQDYFENIGFNVRYRKQVIPDICRAMNTFLVT